MLQALLSFLDVVHKIGHIAEVLQYIHRQHNDQVVQRDTFVLIKIMFHVDHGCQVKIA